MSSTLVEQQLRRRGLSVGIWIGFGLAIALLAVYKGILEPGLPLTADEVVGMSTLLVTLVVAGAVMGWTWGPGATSGGSDAVRLILAMAFTSTVLGAFCVSLSLWLPVLVRGGSALSLLPTAILGLAIFGLPSLIVTAPLASLWWWIVRGGSEAASDAGHE